MSQVREQANSILVADCGSTMTKVVLIEMVEGTYRFVARAEAPSTADTPWDDVSLGVVRAIRAMERTIGRPLLDKEGQLITPERGDGRGVDRFLAVSSSAEPLRVVTVGLARDVSLASARRVVRSTYATIVDELSLERPPGGVARTLDEQINAIWHGSPDVMLLVGGTDGGASKPLLSMVRDVVRVALYLMGEDAPPVIYAGNAELREAVASLLGEAIPLHVVDNVRPRADAEHIGPAAEELEVLFYEHKMTLIPGLDRLDAWSGAVVLPTARAADYTIRYCHEAWKSSKPALGVDVGSASVTINVCHNGRASTTVRTDLGIGHRLEGLLDQVDIADVLRWLPFSIAPSRARDRLLNKTLYPGSIPQTRQDLLLEHAATREALRLALRDSLPGWSDVRSLPEGCIPPCSPIVAGGNVLTRVPSPGHAALILVDALQPLGVSTLYLDESNLMPTLGIVAALEPLATVQTIRSGGLTLLGTVVSPVGNTRRGEAALTVKVPEGSMAGALEVMPGEIRAFPLPDLKPGAKIELKPARGMDIGRGAGKSVELSYRGGVVGLIVDARGRPLPVERNSETQRERVREWLLEMTGE